MDRADFWLSQLLASNIDLSLATVKTLILACSDMDAPDLDRIDYYSNLLIESKINMDSSCYRNILTACCKEGDTVCELCCYFVSAHNFVCVRLMEPLHTFPNFIHSHQGRAQFWFNRLVQSNIQPSHDAIVLVVHSEYVIALSATLDIVFLHLLTTGRLLFCTICRCEQICMNIRTTRIWVSILNLWTLGLKMKNLLRPRQSWSVAFWKDVMNMVI